MARLKCILETMTFLELLLLLHSQWFSDHQVQPVCGSSVSTVIARSVVKISSSGIQHAPKLILFCVAKMSVYYKTECDVYPLYYEL